MGVVEVFNSDGDGLEFVAVDWEHGGGEEGVEAFGAADDDDAGGVVFFLW
jgi:hypothetical protein